MQFSNLTRALSSKIASLMPWIFLVGCNCNGDDAYYKLCDRKCIMHGHEYGDGAYDLPCSDNVTFSIAQWADPSLRPDRYRASNNTTIPLTLYRYAEMPFAMHDPILPGFADDAPPSSVPVSSAAETPGETSEKVTFSLHGNLAEATSVDLYIRIVHSPPSAGPIPTEFGPYALHASWTRASTGVRFSRKNHLTGTTTNDVVKIDYAYQFPKAAVHAGKNTFVNYKFRYGDAGQPPEDREEIEIMFTFDDFSLDVSIPVYVQADPKDVVDVLFMPATDHDNHALPDEFLAAFNANCRAIIADHLFREPTVRFWRKQFNFWISKKRGQAMDYNQPHELCHPVQVIPDDFINVLALLHNAPRQRDYACGNIFTAHVEDGRKVLHELGHSAFNLRDEYRNQSNKQDETHLPNNWETKDGARADAELRHKKPRNAKPIRSY